MSKTTRYLLPTGWKGTGGLGKLAETLDRICSMINGINVIQGGDVFVDKDRIEFRVKGGADATRFALGLESYTIDADAGTATATMREGLVTVGNVTTQIERRNIAVSGSPAYIVMRIERRTRSAGWIDTTISAIPQNNAQYIYVPFVEFQIAQGATFPSLYLIHHAGSLYLP